VRKKQKQNIYCSNFSLFDSNKGILALETNSKNQWAKTIKRRFRGRAPNSAAIFTAFSKKNTHFKHAWFKFLLKNAFLNLQKVFWCAPRQCHIVQRKIVLKIKFFYTSSKLLIKVLTQTKPPSVSYYWLTPIPLLNQILIEMQH